MPGPGRDRESRGARAYRILSSAARQPERVRRKPAFFGLGRFCPCSGGPPPVRTENRDHRTEQAAGCRSRGTRPVLQETSTVRLQHVFSSTSGRLRPPAGRGGAARAPGWQAQAKASANAPPRGRGIRRNAQFPHELCNELHSSGGRACSAARAADCSPAETKKNSRVGQNERHSASHGRLLLASTVAPPRGPTPGHPVLSEQPRCRRIACIYAATSVMRPRRGACGGARCRADRACLLSRTGVDRVLGQYEGTRMPTSSPPTAECPGA